VPKDDDASAAVMRLLAHDLRNPLGAVQLNAQLIERAAAAAGRDQEQRWAALITGAARRMDGMLRHLVEAERLRLGQLELRRDVLAIGEVWRELLDQGEVDPLRVRLALPEERIVVSADRERLGRAIAGVLGWTLQETDGVVTVEVEAGMGEVRSALRAPRPSSGVAAGAPSGGQTHSPPPAIALYFARAVFECHGGAVRTRSEDGRTVELELILPTGAATSART
jgi:K+-sensing histidine kinase KdpD